MGRDLDFSFLACHANMSPFIIFDVTQMTLTAASQNCLTQHVVDWESPLFMNIKINSLWGYQWANVLHRVFFVTYKLFLVLKFSKYICSALSRNLRFL